MMKKIKPRKPGFTLKAGRRQELFIRASSLKEAQAEYCSRTGAKLSDFEPKMPAAPVLSPEKEPENIQEVVADLEEQGIEIPTLAAELPEEGGLE